MKILVRGTNWIGDAVMTIPAIKKLRRLFPDSDLTLQTRDATAGIFRNSGTVDKIVTPGPFLQQIATLRRQRFDLAVIFPNSFESALVTRLAGVKRRFGYATDARAFLLTDPLEIPDWKETRHEVFYYLELVDAIEKQYFGAITTFEDLEPAIDVTPERRARGRDILGSVRGDKRSMTIALAPGSTNSRAKRWPAENFAALNDLIQTSLDANVILLGSRGDAPVSQRVVELSKNAPHDLTGTTDIADAISILSEIDLLISNDMGLAHLAPAVGTSTLVIFGPTNPVTTRPFSDRAAIISANVECSPCMLRDCPIDHRCMTRVTVDQVFERAKAILAAGVLIG